MNAKEILTRTPPDILYHYTTQSGLLGIIKSKEIWATHTQYLNDEREFRHALSVIKLELSKMREEPANHDKLDLLAQMEEGIAGVESMNVCVCSFSAAGDILSQWRAYGGGASGFSIGFSGAFLRAVSEREQFWLVPCLYEESQQRDLMRRLLEDILEEDAQNRAKGKVTHQPPGGNLTAYLVRYAPILKHSSFAEEREWRIISRPLPCTHERFGYRAGRSMLTPYYRILLSGENLVFQVEEIIVGPTPNLTQSRRAVQGLLAKHKLKGTKVRNTAVPYRNW
jgi:hypothetical protein